jgi:hypothetical protein
VIAMRIKAINNKPPPDEAKSTIPFELLSDDIGSVVEKLSTAVFKCVYSVSEDPLLELDDVTDQEDKNDEL